MLIQINEKSGSAGPGGAASRPGGDRDRVRVGSSIREGVRDRVRVGLSIRKGVRDRVKVGLSIRKGVIDRVLNGFSNVIGGCVAKLAGV